MPNQRHCDFCGRSEAGLAAQTPPGSPTLELDADGLWVCHTCRSKLTLPATSETTGELPETLQKLVGENAGAMCRTRNLPYVPPYQSIIDAASTIAYDEDRHMSTWTFATQWPDGTTVWRAHDGESTAFVSPDGTVRIQPA